MWVSRELPLRRKDGVAPPDRRDELRLLWNHLRRRRSVRGRDLRAAVGWGPADAVQERGRVSSTLASSPEVAGTVPGQTGPFGSFRAVLGFRVLGRFFDEEMEISQPSALGVVSP